MSIIDEIGFDEKTGTIREIFFIKMIRNADHRLFYSRTGDFEVDGNIFEIGGKNKTRKQIKAAGDKGHLVKDDILYGNSREIPLYLFGFLY